MESPILDALYEASNREATYLGYVRFMDQVGTINAEIKTFWQPAPASFEAAKQWVDSSVASLATHIEGAGVVSVAVDLRKVRDIYQGTWI